MLTSEMVKAHALSVCEIDEIAIGPLSRFDGAPRQMDPRHIFPEARSFIVYSGRIPRGVYRGIEEGTNFGNYNYYGYYLLNMIFNQAKAYDLCTFIEDHGHEAVPHYPGVPEVQPAPDQPVLRQGAPAPQVEAQVRIAGAAAGLGEIGYSKNFLSPRFGPRVRLGMILTDAVLDYDPIREPELCDRCMACVAGCPGSAIPAAEEDKTVSIKIEDRDVSWADVHIGKCTLTHFGMNKKTNPFLHRDLPGIDFDVAAQDGVSEEEAVRFSRTLLTGSCRATKEFPNPLVSQWVTNAKHFWNYIALCGAKGCICACADHLEQKKAIGNLFHNKRRKRPAWKLPRPRKVAPRPEDLVEE